MAPASMGGKPVEDTRLDTGGGARPGASILKHLGEENAAVS
ncbi:MAG: hypothetical protein ACPL4E_06215 [Thermoproteota archaeon]